MSGIRQWAFSACAAAVAVGMVRIILPKTSLERMFSLTVSVFFLCCLLSPLVIRNPDLNLEAGGIVWEQAETNGQDLRELADRQALELAKENLRKMIGDKLLELGINYREITINITTNGQSGVEITDIVITLEEQYKSRNNEVRSNLKDELGLDVKIAYT